MFMLHGFRGTARLVCVVLALCMASSCSSPVENVDPPVDESTLLPQQLVFHYIYQGDASKLDSFLKSNPDMVNIPEDDTNYNTPLHVAAITGNWSIVKVLLDNGADPNIENSNGEIPAESALQASGDLELTRYLQEAAQAQSQPAPQQ